MPRGTISGAPFGRVTVRPPWVVGVLATGKVFCRKLTTPGAKSEEFCCNKSIPAWVIAVAWGCALVALMLWSQLEKKNILFFLMGPPPLKSMVLLANPARALRAAVPESSPAARYELNARFSLVWKAFSAGPLNVQVAMP